ncbi:MAG: sugar phosphate isomerase/epimerase [Bacteroidales bacterium]
MKKTSLVTYVLVLALLVPFASLEGAPKAKKKQIGIATYSVKGLESDIEGSLKALADYGYTVMEISNYNAGRGTVAGYSPADYAALAKKYGLDIISSHARAKFDVKDVPGTLEAWGKLFDDHKIMGCKYVVFPMNTWSSDVEALKAECSLLNQIGTEAGKRGIKFGYHNHSMEFATVPNTDLTFEDFLIQNTDPDKVFFQMDVYWITVGGQDPVTYLKKYPNRFSVLHIKDDYVIGESGKINYQAIFKQFYKNGHKDWFVEMEAKMTDEQRKQSVAMMEMMKQRMSQGGQQGQQQGPPQGQQAGAPPQGGQRQGGAPGGNAGFGQRDPQAQAAMLKESLEGIRLSAEYLKNAKFVK